MSAARVKLPPMRVGLPNGRTPEIASGSREAREAPDLNRRTCARDRRTNQSRAMMTQAPGSSPLTRGADLRWIARSEEHTSELQSLMRISYAVFCLKKKKTQTQTPNSHYLYHDVL